MKNVILNIPHASTIIPNWAQKDILIPSEELDELVNFMVDKDVDKMWEFVSKQNKVVANVSRIVVDTERFTDDSKEPMATKGMGMFYTHTPNGKLFRLRKEESYEKALDIYNSYHKELEEKVKNCLAKHGECIILDCHSFHDEMDYTDYQPKAFPDVCIGIDGDITPETGLIIDTFKYYGYSVKVNEPFAGSIVPLKYLNDNRVKSVMIELNRRIYDNNNFSKVQTICKEIYSKLG